jgi:hypothetical protein
VRFCTKKECRRERHFCSDYPVVFPGLFRRAERLQTCVSQVSEGATSPQPIQNSGRQQGEPQATSAQLRKLDQDPRCSIHSTSLSASELLLCGEGLPWKEPSERSRSRQGSVTASKLSGAAHTWDLQHRDAGSKFGVK